jgi:serine/threonine protein kinase
MKQKFQLIQQHQTRAKSPPFHIKSFKIPSAHPNQQASAQPTSQEVQAPPITAPLEIGKTIGRTVPAGEITREQLFKYVTYGFTVKSGTDMCFQEQLNRNIFLEYLMESRIGSGSINGEAYRVCSPFVCTNDGCQCTKDTVHVAIKLVPIRYEAWKLKQKAQASPYAQELVVNNTLVDEEGMKRYEVWVEITAMTLANALVQQSVCPNLPLLFHWFICNSCHFRNEELLDELYDYPNNRYITTVRQAQQGRVALKDSSLITPCAIIMNELANGGDLKTWCHNRKLPPGAAKSMMFQITSGLYALKKYFNMHHNDLHSGNVLVHKLPASHANGAFKYRIDGRDYYVPHYGYLFVLWDFGYATIEGNEEAGEASLHAMTLTSFESIPTYEGGDMERISQILMEYHEKIDLDHDDPHNFQLGDNDDIDLVNDLAEPEGFDTYAEVFQDVFWPIFKKPLNNVESEWNMDKPLEPFADADLNRFIIPLTDVTSEHDIRDESISLKDALFPTCKQCGTIADSTDRFCAECANPFSTGSSRFHTYVDDEATMDAVHADKRQKTADSS